MCVHRQVALLVGLTRSDLFILCALIGATDHLAAQLMDATRVLNVRKARVVAVTIGCLPILGNRPLERFIIVYVSRGDRTPGSRG